MSENAATATNTFLSTMRSRREDDKVLDGGWNCLKPYGLQYLTGEACALSMRGLIDLNRQGVALLTEFFGGNVTFREGSNWNCKVNGSDAVASIMLTHDMIAPLQKFILFRIENFRWIAVFGNTMYGVANEEHLAVYQEMKASIYNNGAWKPTGTTGRNTHAFSGRTE